RRTTHPPTAGLASTSATPLIIVHSYLVVFNAPPTTEIYTLSLHDALPIFTLSYVNVLRYNVRIFLGGLICVKSFIQTMRLRQLVLTLKRLKREILFLSQGKLALILKAEKLLKV